MTDRIPESAKIYLLWVLGEMSDQISKVRIQVRSMQELLQDDGCITNFPKGRHLVEVLQELQSEQELR